MSLTRCFTCDSEISYLQYPPPVPIVEEFKPRLLASPYPRPTPPASSHFGQFEWSNNQDRNTQKLSTILRYFLPTSSRVSLQKFQQELSSHKFPLCPECDEHVEKIQEIEKEVDSLKFLITSLIASLQFKVKSTLQHPQQVQASPQQTETETEAETEAADFPNHESETPQAETIPPKPVPVVVVDGTLAALRENLLSLKAVEDSSLDLKDLRVALTRINTDGCTTVSAANYGGAGGVGTKQKTRYAKRGRPPKSISDKKKQQQQQLQIRKRINKTTKKVYKRIASGPAKLKLKHKIIKQVEGDTTEADLVDNNNLNEGEIGEANPGEIDVHLHGEVPVETNIDEGETEEPTIPATRTSHRAKRKPMKFYSSDEEGQGERLNNDDNIHEIESDADWNSGNELVDLDSGEECEYDEDGNVYKDIEIIEDDDQKPDPDEIAHIAENSPDTGTGTTTTTTAKILAPSDVKVPRPRIKRKAGSTTEKTVKEKKKRVAKKRESDKPVKRVLTRPPRTPVKITEIQPRLFQFQEGCQFVQVEEDQFKCCTCNKIFSKRTRVIVHIRYIHLGYDLGLLGEYLCNLCGKSFNREGTLKLHEQSMHGTKSHMCSICGRLFSLAGNLRSHMLIHGEQRKYACEVENCDRKFLRKKELMYHMNKHHLNIRPHQCDQCGKTYTRHSELLLHQRGHSGQRPYQCSLCESAFFIKSRLSRHLKKVHHIDKPVVSSIEGVGDGIIGILSTPTAGAFTRGPNHIMSGAAGSSSSMSGNIGNATTSVDFNEMQVCDEFVANLINVVTAPVIISTASLVTTAASQVNNSNSNNNASE